MALRVMTVDDHPIVRNGVKSLLASGPEGGAVDVIGEAADGRQAIEAARKLRPDVIIMDPAMPKLNGADATSQICRENPHTAVIALSMHSDERYVRRMLVAGASAYVLKTCTAEELCHAIRVAHEGGTYLTPDVAASVVEGYLNGQTPSPSAGEDLSEREREVLQLIAEGKTAKEIGRLLHVSSRTIDSHRQRIMAKLKANSVAELTKHAIRMGLTAV